MFRKAIDINPGYSKAYGNLGKLYTDKQDYKEAESILKIIAQIDPEYADGFMRLGLLYLELEKYSDAADNLEKSIEIDKKDYKYDRVIFIFIRGIW